MRLAVLPFPVSWAVPPASCRSDEQAAATVTAGPRTDLFVDPGGGEPVLTAPRLLGVPPEGDFQLSARVGVGFTETYDAGVLLVWADERLWAKLCFERSPQGEPTAVSVVTRDVSDDANGFVVAGDTLWLRVSRLGAAWAFHGSTDGRFWRFVRYSRLSRRWARAVPSNSIGSPSGRSGWQTCGVAIEGRSRLRPRMAAVTEGGRVTALELFFDLVFVFALTQVTAVMGRNGGSAGDVLRGLLVLALLWWCWCCYAWLGNTVRADTGVTRLALFGVMATMFVVALSIPEAFHDAAGGLPAPAVFVACYLVVRVLHLTVYWHAAEGDPGLRRQVLRASLPMLAGASLLAVAATAAETIEGRTALWAAALGVDYLGIFLTGARGWRINSAAHWAERHSLIVIVALGESIVSIGVGLTGEPISWPVVAASILGIAIAGAFWWTYFVRQADAAEHALAALDGAPRAALARDSYTYLHFPMIAGIILLSLGLKKAFADLGEPLKPVGLYALYGGAMTYLLAQVGFRLRGLGTVGWSQVVAVAVLAALMPFAAWLPALAAVALLTAVCVTLVAVEARRD